MPCSERRLHEAREHLASLTIEHVLDRGLHDTLTWIVGTAASISQAIHDEFFDPSPSTLAVGEQPA